MHVAHFHHVLPLWFLVLSLFLPRIALVVCWLDGWYFFVSNLVGAVLWLVLPRVLVLLMIAHAQGLGPWFWLHLVVAVMVWGGSGSAVRSRR